MNMCCETMGTQLALVCPDHAEPADCPDSLVARWPNGIVGLRIHDGGASISEIFYCPWCGTPVKGWLG